MKTNLIRRTPAIANTLILWCLLTILVFASADYSPFEGDSLRKGVGGTKKIVDGIDIWNNGTPPGTYRILGILEDTRGTGFLSNMRFYPSIAEQTKKAGGDAAIIISADVQAAGTYTTPAQVNAQTNFGITTATVTGGDTYTIRCKTTHVEVIRYISAPNSSDNLPAQKIDSSTTHTSTQPTESASKEHTLLDHYRAEAEEGNEAAALHLGLLYLTGKEVSKDYAQALIWLQKSADADDAVAQENLGWMYQNGFGVDKSYAKALALYQQSADKNNMLAENNLGMCYQNGWGTSQDYHVVLAWYQKAADQGNVAAEFSVGLVYSNGWGVPKNPAKGLTWLCKASDEGNSFAPFYIGSMYENGWGVPKNIDIALAWYKKALASGNIEAASALKRIGRDR